MLAIVAFLRLAADDVLYVNIHAINLAFHIFFFVFEFIFFVISKPS